MLPQKYDKHHREDYTWGMKQTSGGNRFLRAEKKAAKLTASKQVNGGPLSWLLRAELRGRDQQKAQGPWPESWAKVLPGPLAGCVTLKRVPRPLAL